MTTITNIHATECLDSRGFPTVSVQIILSCAAVGQALVPSGASTGSQEALELRDKDNSRYMGKGVQTAVTNINHELAVNLIGLDADEQRKIDMLMCAIDGTDNKRRLGANAILAVSLALAKAAAQSHQVELYQYLGTLYGNKSYNMPLPMMNILNGGCHADNNIDIQEFMIQPVGAANFTEGVRQGVEIYYHLKDLLKQKNFNTAVGDEGGFAPNLASNAAALEMIVQAIKKSGYHLGSDIKLALDCAATEFYTDNNYYLQGDNQYFSASEFIDYLANLSKQYPINSIEDCLDENDWQSWKIATQKLGSTTQLVGDDLFVTNTKFLQQGIKEKVANAILIKLNQVGTLTQTLECIKLAQDSDYGVVISHRSGETEDTFIADLAVATGAGQIKTGAVCRSDRVAKYNRLLVIDEQLEGKVAYGI